MSGSRPRAEAPRVLVVDDHPTNRVILEALAADEGWDSTSVCDGAEAVEACQNEGPFDLIFMDLRMPVMNGAEATRRIRQQGGWAALVPILGVTADYCDSVRTLCLQAGMSECVAKPIQPLALTAFMRRSRRFEAAPSRAAPATKVVAS